MPILTLVLTPAVWGLGERAESAYRKLQGFVAKISSICIEISTFSASPTALGWLYSDSRQY